MDVEELLDDVRESERSWEEFYREILDPFIQTGVWEPEGYEWKYGINAMAEYRRAVETDETPEDGTADQLIDLMDEHGPTAADNEFILRYGGVTPGTGARLHLHSFDRADPGILHTGRMEYIPPEIDSSRIAEEGTLLHELRGAYQRIAAAHQTPYTESMGDLNENPQVGYPSEQLLQVTIPVDYDPDTYRRTANELAAAAVQLEDLYRGMRGMARGFQPEADEN